MSSPPSPPTDSTAQQPQLLEIPTLPSPSSRFVLPPPPSDLLNRLQAFLPQIRDANAELEGRMREDGLGEGEEAVVMEELSESEEDSSSDEEEGSSSEEESEEDEDEKLADAESEAVQGGQEVEQEEEAGSLARLMDISARPKVVKKNLVVEEETAGAGGE
ncbi:hypothetical protein RTBOTA2_003120 [Rhodotorula toruloides]|nr:hypothetical protein RTBOTA2_003120 [Rhodotorula toruloides]